MDKVWNNPENIQEIVLQRKNEADKDKTETGKEKQRKTRKQTGTAGKNTRRGRKDEEGAGTGEVMG